MSSTIPALPRWKSLDMAAVDENDNNMHLQEVDYENQPSEPKSSDGSLSDMTEVDESRSTTPVAHNNPFDAPFSASYDKHTRSPNFHVKNNFSKPDIMDLDPKRFWHHQILDLFINPSDKRQSKHFLFRPSNSSERISYRELESLPDRYPGEVGGLDNVTYIQVHSARQQLEFHKDVAKLPKGTVRKENEKQCLSDAEREICFSIFGYALCAGVPLPIQSPTQSYSDAMGKKPKSGKVGRPPNSFITYSSSLRAIANKMLQSEDQKKLLLQHGVNYFQLFEETVTKKFQNAVLSRALSEFWNEMMLPREKCFWDDESKQLQCLHKKEYPDYKLVRKSPKKKREKSVMVENGRVTKRFLPENVALHQQTAAKLIKTDQVRGGIV